MWRFSEVGFHKALRINVSISEGSEPCSKSVRLIAVTK